MRMMIFSRRNAKEILRDPLNLAFGLGFPVVLLLLLTAIQRNVPQSLFPLDRLTPGIAVFGLSFITLFSATLISKDRKSAFLERLYTTPLTGSDFILGYTLPLLPIAVGQTVITYLTAVILGLPMQKGIFLSVLQTVPSAILFTAIGLLCGSVLTDKQVGGICGAMLTNLTAWLSGAWFDLDLVGGAFRKLAVCLPFYHSVESGKAALAMDLSGILPHILITSAYAGVFLIAAVWVFLRQMKH